MASINYNHFTIGIDDDILSSNFNLYPNPFSESTTINLKNYKPNLQTSLIISDVVGNILRETKIKLSVVARAQSSSCQDKRARSPAYPPDFL